MTSVQDKKAAGFRELHARPGAFVIPNPWDVGSARILASMNFEALATTSAGFAHSIGVRDGSLSRDQVLAHCRDIAEATTLPVSADLENGFGLLPEDVAETIKLAADTGIVGGSIEDYSGLSAAPIIDFTLAVERIHAAAEAKKALSHDFLLTARSENFVWGCTDLDDTINRLLAFAGAGADVLYAPGLEDLESLRMLCGAVPRPVNVVIEMENTNLSLTDLAEVGAKRISVGSKLFLSAYGAFFCAATELQQSGTFSFASDAIAFSKLESIFGKKY